MTKNLFDDFNAVSSKQWKQKIQFELDGANYNDTLIWKTNENIDVKPFYNADDVDKLLNISNTKVTQWKIHQSLYVDHVEESNLLALELTSKKEIDSITFIIPSANTSIKKLVKNIDYNKVQLYFELQFISKDFIKLIQFEIPNAKIHLDIIGQLTKTGNWFNNLNSDLKSFVAITKENNTISINSSLYQNAGANMTQQLAYSLAHINEYLNILENSKFNLQTLHIIFNISIGTNYFFEIAKLKALRLLWKTLALEYNTNINCEIITTPTKRNKTLYDSKTNLLRTTTECMSAILGGANAVNNIPFDYIYRKNNRLSKSISIEQLVSLKNESYFNKVNNPTDGAYYIENLTNQLSKNALELFKNIEDNGGFLKQLKLGTIQRKIKESALKEQQQFDNNKIILVGTNKYQNINNKMKSELKRYPFIKTNKRKTLIEPIIEKRLSEHLEQKRLKNEN